MKNSSQAKSACAIASMALCILAGAAPTYTTAQALPWMNTALTPAQRAVLLVNAMTLDQKIQQIKMAGGTNPDLPGYRRQ